MAHAAPFASDDEGYLNGEVEHQPVADAYPSEEDVEREEQEGLGVQEHEEDEDEDEVEEQEDEEQEDEEDEDEEAEDNEDMEPAEDDRHELDGEASDEDGAAEGSFQSADDEDDDFDLPQDLAPGVGVGAVGGEEEVDGHGAASSGGAQPPGLDDSDGAGHERWNLRTDGNKEELERIWARLSADREHTKISKMFSYVLRHAAHKLGVCIRKDGFVRLREIMKLRNFKPYTLEELMAAVYFDEKERYTMVREFDGELLIRANQGHTMKVVEDDLLLEVITDPTEVTECVHGTYLVHWPFIKRQGISKVARNHIHLANGLPEDGKIRGMRSTAELFVYLDVGKAMEDGIIFYRSKNDVILTQGFEGWLPVKYFIKAQRIDYNTCDIEDLEFDCENAPIPEWPAELAPSGPGDQGTYTIKNLEALISNCKKRLQEINELKALQDRGQEMDEEDMEKIGKYAQAYTELQSLEQRFRQHKGYRRESVQDREQRAKEQAEATTVVRRKDRALTPPWDKGKSHLESVGMKSTEKEKAEWAAIGRRRDTAGPSGKKEDQWDALGRGRKSAPTTPAGGGSSKRDDSTKRGKGAKAARGDEFQRSRTEHLGRPEKEENWRSGKEDAKKQLEEAVTHTQSGPPRFFNSKKSSESLGWREREALALSHPKPDELEERQPSPDQLVEHVNTDESLSWRTSKVPSQRSSEQEPSWRSKMSRLQEQPPQQPPSWREPPAPPSQPPSWRDQPPQQPPRTDGQGRLGRAAPPPLQGDSGPRLQMVPPPDEFPPSVVPPPPSTPAPMTMPPMMPNPAVANAPQAPAGGTSAGPMASQGRGSFGPPPGPADNNIPQMMPNPLVGSMQMQGGQAPPNGMPTTPTGMHNVLSQGPCGGMSPAQQQGLQSPSAQQCGSVAAGMQGMQPQMQMQAMGSGGGMQTPVGMQAGAGMVPEAGMGRYMSAVPMWQNPQMQGGQVCGYSPAGQAQPQPQLFCTPGPGSPSHQGNTNFGTSPQSPQNGGGWLRQGYGHMDQQGGSQGMQQGYGHMDQQGGSQGMQQAMAGGGYGPSFTPGGEARPQGPCYGYNGSRQGGPRSPLAYEGHPQQPQQQQQPQGQAFGYGGGAGFGGRDDAGQQNPRGKGGGRQWQNQEAGWRQDDYGYDDYGGDSYNTEDMNGQWRKGGGGGGKGGKDNGGGKGGGKKGKGGGGKGAGGGGGGGGGGGRGGGKGRDRDGGDQDWAAIGRRRAAA